MTQPSHYGDSKSDLSAAKDPDKSKAAVLKLSKKLVMDNASELAPGSSNVKSNTSNHKLIVPYTSSQDINL